jgi:deoxyribodipyrimidine photo-lyase
MSPSPTAVVWFRRDLRVHDHPALDHALGAADRIVPLFVVDDRLLTGRWRSPNRIWFLAGAIRSLATELERRGGGLLVERGDPVRIVAAVAARFGADLVVASRDLTPYGRARDAAVADALRAGGVAFRARRGLLVHEPEDVRRADGEPFVVFSPFQRAWLALPLRPTLPAPTAIPIRDFAAPDDPAALFGDPAPTAEAGAILEPSEDAARARLDRWAPADPLVDYANGRDRLDLTGTSRLSQDLRFGLLSPVEGSRALRRRRTRTGPVPFGDRVA